MLVLITIAIFILLQVMGTTTLESIGAYPGFSAACVAKPGCLFALSARSRKSLVSFFSIPFFQIWLKSRRAGPVTELGEEIFRRIFLTRDPTVFSLAAVPEQLLAALPALKW
jgi:hypothetical protein